MFVRNCWYVAAWDYELPEGQIISRMILNEPVVLYRTGDAGIVGLEDRCCHRFAPLSLGRLESGGLRCMYHGLKFDRAGQCIEIPGQDRIPPQARVKTYPVAEKHSWIWVWMGDPARADVGLIPPAIGLNDPDWTLRSGHLDYQANYLLINDNLTDFTHLSYVHAGSFGTPEAFAYTRPLVERLDRGIRVSRWSHHMASEGTARVTGQQRGADVWTGYDFLAPGVLLMPTVNLRYPEGTAERLGGAKPDLAQGEVLRDTFTSQAVTPTTDTTARYFFNWGPRSGEGSDAVAESMIALALKAFAEDKTMIEAQQRTIALDPGRKEILTSADVGPMMMRSVLQQLIKAEASGMAANAA